MIKNTSDKTTFKIYLKSLFNNYKEIEHFFEKDKVITAFSFEKFKNDEYFKDVIGYNTDRISNLLIDTLDAKKSNSSNVFIVETNRFKQFINIFLGNALICWKSISAIDNVNWNFEILENGKDLWDWKSIQLNTKLVDYFKDFEVIERYVDFLDWKIVSADKRLIWNFYLIYKFKNKLNFSDNVASFDYERYNHQSLEKCFQNFSKGDSGTTSYNKVYFNVGCLSDKQFLNDEIIVGFSEYWDWKILSSNPSISTKMILKFQNNWDWLSLSRNPTIFKDEVFFYENLHLFNMFQLAQNPGLTIQCLRFFKNFYKKDFGNGFGDSVTINDVKVSWSSSFWYEAFKIHSIIWNAEFIDEFIEILNDSQSEYKNYEIDKYGKYDMILGFRGSNEWKSISSNIIDRNTIISYRNKLDFISLAINNENLVWDIELIDLLLMENLPLISGKFRVVGLPGVLEKIKITKEVIIHFKDYWFKEYNWEYYNRNSDGTELRTHNFPLWRCFEKNKKINWDMELNEIFDIREYNIDDMVLNIATGKKAIIVATKNRPWKKENDVYMRKEIFPKNDYLVNP